MHYPALDLRTTHGAGFSGAGPVGSYPGGGGPFNDWYPGGSGGPLGAGPAYGSRGALGVDEPGSVIEM
ncbi:hypothetical protein FZI91_15725 [Mycobacterium sp. CBMA271]|nr:hypothetical protein [Mycobacteroides sp. CBMA 326]MUM23146.1 hypothetical protein [Mycobacteroides sp. CBMA 271]